MTAITNLKNDPDELVNLVHDTAHQDRTAFANEVASRWDITQSARRCYRKTKAKTGCLKTMQKAFVDWDYNPKRDSANEYVRNHITWTDAAELTRFPPYEK